MKQHQKLLNQSRRTNFHSIFKYFRKTIGSRSSQSYLDVSQCVLNRLHARSVPEFPKPGTEIIRQQFRFFHRGEVAPAWHFSPTLHIEKTLGPFARRVT